MNTLKTISTFLLNTILSIVVAAITVVAAIAIYFIILALGIIMFSVSAVIATLIGSVVGYVIALSFPFTTASIMYWLGVPAYIGLPQVTAAVSFVSYFVKKTMFKPTHDNIFQKAYNGMNIVKCYFIPTPAANVVTGSTGSNTPTKATANKK